MAHTDACKIQVCQLVEHKIKSGMSARKAFQEAQEESDGIPARTIEKWWQMVQRELNTDPSPPPSSNKNDSQGYAVSRKAPAPNNSNNLYICPDCGGQFGEPVWHCQTCGSHWRQTTTECKNCQPAMNKTEPEPPPPEPEKPEPAPAKGAVFNETNDNIEWARWTWNPVTGCKHGCKYCYARDIANRFYKEKFEPTFHPHRLKAPFNTPFPTEIKRSGDKNVFVCSMADLFGDWVPHEWIDKVLKVVSQSPKWNFLFLTKNPKRMADAIWPDNAWVGTTVDAQLRVKPAEEAFASVNAKVKFISCEPLSEELTFSRLHLFNWVIIGARSRSTQCPEMQPERAWVRSLIDQAVDADCMVYCKPNLKTLIKEFPA